MMESMYITHTAEQLFTSLEEQAGLMSSESLCALEKTLAACMALVKRARNSLRPVNTLPAEVLGLIFGYIPEQTAFLQTINGMWQSTVVNNSDLVAVTHVCHQWREVALSIPALWKDISDLNMGAPPQEVLFRRSKTMPLKIFINRLGSQTAQLLLSHGSRIKELYWFNIDYPGHWPYLSFPAPNLEQLSIQYTPGTDPDGPETHARLPNTFFDGQTPRLRRLCLLGVPWIPCNQFQSLNFLQLDCEYHRPLMSDLVSLLSGSPNLVDIILCIRDFDFAASVGILEKDDRVVSLPHLRRLLFRDMYHLEIANILSHLDLQVTTAVRLSQQRLWSQGLLLQALASLPPVQSATKLFLRQGDVHFAISVVGPSAGVHIDYISTDGDPRTVLSAIIPVGEITELWFLDSQNLGPRKDGRTHTFIRHFLQSLPALKLLAVYDYDLQATIKALISLRTEGRLRCHELTSLVVIFTRNAWISEARTIQMLAASHGQLSFTHLIVEFSEYQEPDQPCITPDSWSQLTSHFDSVVFSPVESLQAPSISMPDVCTTEGHMWWPSWKSYNI